MQNTWELVNLDPGPEATEVDGIISILRHRQAVPDEARSYGRLRAGPQRALDEMEQMRRQIGQTP